MKLRDQVEQQWRRLRQQWQEQTRVRMAGWAILALLVLNLIALCGSWKDAKREEHAHNLMELKKVQELAQQSYWPERAVQAEGRLSQYRAHLWKAQNSSIARANVQAWLSREVSSAGLQDAKINVLEPLDFTGGKDARVEVQLRGQFDPRSYGKLLYAIEGSEQWISIDTVELNNGLSPSLNIQLAFHFLAQEDAPPMMKN